MNQRPGHTRCIAFRWMPTAEDYRRVVARIEEMPDFWTGSSFDFARAVFELDVLGLRAVGAAREAVPDDDAA